jgi:hypothetical protein
MGPMQVDGVQERVAGGWERRPATGLLFVGWSDQAGCGELIEHAGWLPVGRVGRSGESAASCSTVWPPSTRSALRVRMAVGRSSVTGSASLATAAWYVRQKLCRDSTVRVPLLTAAPPPGPVNTRASGSLVAGSWRRIASTTSGARGTGRMLPAAPLTATTTTRCLLLTNQPDHRLNLAELCDTPLGPAPAELVASAPQRPLPADAQLVVGGRLSDGGSEWLLTVLVRHRLL